MNKNETINFGELTASEIEARGHEIAEKLGIQFNGIEELIPGKKIYLFTDNETESSFAVKLLDEETVKKELEITRAKFKESN